MFPSYICLSPHPVAFGAPLPQSLAAILNYKLPTPQAVRKTALEGHRWTPQELHAIGVVDVLAEGDTDGVLAAARELAKQKAPLAKSGVWGLMKEDLLRWVLKESSEDNRRTMPVQAAALARARL